MINPFERVEIVQRDGNSWIRNVSRDEALEATLTIYDRSQVTFTLLPGAYLPVHGKVNPTQWHFQHIPMRPKWT